MGWIATSPVAWPPTPTPFSSSLAEIRAPIWPKPAPNPATSTTISPPSWPTCKQARRPSNVRRTINNRDCAARDTDQSIVLVGNFDLPDLRGAPFEQRHRCSRDHALALGPQMISINLQPEGHLALLINAQHRPQRGQRLGQYYRDAAVQITHLLSLIRSHRHRRHHLILIRRNQLDV